MLESGLVHVHVTGGKGCYFCKLLDGSIMEVKGEKIDKSEGGRV